MGRMGVSWLEETRLWGSDPSAALLGHRCRAGIVPSLSLSDSLVFSVQRRNRFKVEGEGRSC